MSFDQFHTIASDFARRNPTGTFKLLSIGCSSGEEVYSYAFVLEELRKIFPSFNYKITGIDIDPVSINQGRSAIYQRVKIDFIEDRWRPLVLRRIKHDDTLKVESTVTNGVEFLSANILQMQPLQEKFDFISCRNILIYFDPGQIDQIVSKIIFMLKPEGHFCTGVSETGVVNRPEFKSLGSTIFQAAPRPVARRASKPLTSQSLAQAAGKIAEAGLPTDVPSTEDQLSIENLCLIFCQKFSPSALALVALKF
jgi:chemotaxis methyl-accepting protein methylase